MCVVRHDVDESSTNMEGAFRIWNRIKPTKEMFHSLKSYLDTRFKHMKLSIQNKNQLVYGYAGVKLIPIQYTKKLINNDVENFLFEICNFSSDGKILNSTLISEYQKWKQNLNKEICTDDIFKIKEYLNTCEYVIKSTVHVNGCGNEGYYGIQLKSDTNKYKTTSSTGKKVEKVDSETEIILQTWETIAKASADEGMSPATMSRSIRDKKMFNNGYNYYYRTSK
jgi:hypothetical protein